MTIKQQIINVIFLLIIAFIFTIFLWTFDKRLEKNKCWWHWDICSCDCFNINPDSLN